MAHNWRKQRELLLGIEYPEDRAKRWALKKILEKKDAEIEAASREFERVGTCPQCHLMRTSEGKCSLGCS